MSFKIICCIQQYCILATLIVLPIWITSGAVRSIAKTYYFIKEKHKKQSDKPWEYVNEDKSNNA